MMQTNTPEPDMSLLGRGRWCCATCWDAVALAGADRIGHLGNQRVVADGGRLARVRLRLLLQCLLNEGWCSSRVPHLGPASGPA
jgi:hypothetical protein